MKSEINNIKATEPLTFPALYSATSTHYGIRVVLFSSETIGTVLYCERDRKPVTGLSEQGWVPCTSLDTWKPFTGVLTLRN